MFAPKIYDFSSTSKKAISTILLIFTILAPTQFAESAERFPFINDRYWDPIYEKATYAKQKEYYNKEIEALQEKVTISDKIVKETLIYLEKNMKNPTESLDVVQDHLYNQLIKESQNLYTYNIKIRNLVRNLKQEIIVVSLWGGTPKAYHSIPLQNY